MTDFLDRFDDQLRASQLRYASQQRAAGARARLLGRRPWRRIALAAAVTLGVAVPAAAVVAPWEPTLFRAGVDEPISTDAKAVDDSASEWLAVLRRPQTAEDREASAPLLHVLGAGNQVQGVQTDGIRSLAKGWALVPVSALRGPDGTAEGLCLVDGQASMCGQLRMIRETGIIASLADASHSEFAGLVPDGVERVRFTPVEGAPIEAQVASNFYHLSVNAVQPAEVPAKTPPLPVVGQLEWLDGAGNTIRPGA